MSNEFIDRLNNGSLTQIGQYRETRINLAPAANRLASGASVGDDWKTWELAPEWTANDNTDEKRDVHLIDGAGADKLRDAVGLLARKD
jgi:hypothetical protein